jgi:hypothetical protein
MSNEACALALKNTLNETRNVCPEISHAFVFRENGEILAEDDNTNEAAVNDAQEPLRALAERATAVGGIESITFRGTESKVNIIQFDDLFITTVSSDGADEKTVFNLARVMIPTTLKVMQKFYPSIKNRSQEEATLKPEPINYEPEPIAPEIQASEFTVENLTVFGGFMIDPETAYIDIALIVQWSEIYGDKPIKQITLEAPSTGKTTQAKFRPFKDTKYENRGIVQLSEKIQTALQIQKGSKVLIKPVLEVQEDTETVQAKKTKNPHKSITPSKPDLIRREDPGVIPVEKMENSKESSESPKVDLFRGFEKYKQNAPVIQVIVENLRGIVGRIGNPDFVRVDSVVIARWNEIFGDKEIKEVLVKETIFGKEIRCRFQAIKDSQLKGKAVIQIPEKLQQTLRTKRGALVLIKPVVE